MKTAARTTSDPRWLAVRERRDDRSFFYAVTTTGVYCRPCCSSRQPRPENVRFFASCDAAERAGFRACRKCGPRSTRFPAVIVRACRMLHEAEHAPSLGALSRAAGLSVFHFHRLFKQTVGITPKAFGAAARAGRLRAGLRSRGTVTQAIYSAGYSSSARCYENAVRQLGMTPGQYKSGAPGQAIRFATARTTLGWMLVAATECGICLIELGESARSLTASMRTHFPRAEFREAGRDFTDTLRRVVSHVESPHRRVDLPLDIQGTAFQQRVWAELQKIPAGKTASYTELARRIGRPTATRAVASACAANRLAVAIPCHRAVRASGALSGYRWGVERKKRLLDRERV